MKNNFSLKFNIKDIFVAIIAAVLIIGSLIYVNTTKINNIDDKVVEIYYKQQKLNKYSIKFSDVNEEIKIILTKEEYPDLLGDFTILINKEKGISVTDITCPNHYCEQQGWVKQANYPVTCLPNGVYIIISSISDDEIIVG